MIKVYKFGLLRPTENGDLVIKQMRLAHTYGNSLVEIERGRRAHIRGIYSSCGDEQSLERAVADIEATVVDVAKAIKARRAETRSRSEKQSDRDALRDARQKLSAARAELSAYRRSLRDDPEIVARIALVDGAKDRSVESGKRDSSKRNDGLAAQLHRSARTEAVEHGLYWGTYLLVEKAHQAARSAPFYADGKPNDPRFSRWENEGLVGVQIQHQAGKADMLPCDLFGNDTRVRVDPVDARAWTSPVRGERRRLSRTVLHLRVGSEGRAPIWASWPMIMHRPLPEGAVIKWVVVGVRRVGPREEWTCDITVDVPDVDVEPNDRGAPISGPRGSAVAVHLGWLETGSGLRVATWMDTSGETGELVIGKGGLDETDIDGGRGGVLSGIRKADDIRSIRDKNFNAARDSLVAWLREHDMVEWMRSLTIRRGLAVPSKAQALAYLSGWRSPARLASLARRWRDARFDGDEDVFASLESWRYHDYHLWEWECNQRIGALRRRREVYRRFAATIAGRYSTVLVDGVKLDGLARRPTTEASGEATAARTNRQSASVSELRNVLENAVSSQHGKATRIESAGLSISCPECGTKDDAHADVASHSFACTSCTFVRDVDKTALMNMLRRGGFDGAVDCIIERGKRVSVALKTSA
jgi:Putative transposase DNA-binding domain